MYKMFLLSWEKIKQFLNNLNFNQQENHKMCQFVILGNLIINNMFEKLWEVVNLYALNNV